MHTAAANCGEENLDQNGKAAGKLKTGECIPEDCVDVRTLIKQCNLLGDGGEWDKSAVSVREVLQAVQVIQDYRRMLNKSN